MSLKGVPIFELSTTATFNRGAYSKTDRLYCSITAWQLEQMCLSLPVEGNFLGIKRVNGYHNTKYLIKITPKVGQAYWVRSTMSKVKAALKEEREKKLILGLAKVE